MANIQFEVISDGVIARDNDYSVGSVYETFEINGDLATYTYDFHSKDTSVLPNDNISMTADISNSNLENANLSVAVSNVNGEMVLGNINPPAIEGQGTTIDILYIDSSGGISGSAEVTVDPIQHPGFDMSGVQTDSSIFAEELALADLAAADGFSPNADIMMISNESFGGGGSSKDESIPNTLN